MNFRTYANRIVIGVDRKQPTITPWQYTHSVLIYSPEHNEVRSVIVNEKVYAKLVGSRPYVNEEYTAMARREVNKVITREKLWRAYKKPPAWKLLLIRFIQWLAK